MTPFGIVCGESSKGFFFSGPLCITLETGEVQFNYFTQFVYDMKHVLYKT